MNFYGISTLSAYTHLLCGIKKSVFPRIETGYAFTKDMNDELVEKFNTGNFTEGSAILKFKYYNPRDLIVQHLPVKEREKKLKLTV